MSRSGCFSICWKTSSLWQPLNLLFDAMFCICCCFLLLLLWLCLFMVRLLNVNELEATHLHSITSVTQDAMIHVIFHHNFSSEQVKSHTRRQIYNYITLFAFKYTYFTLFTSKSFKFYIKIFHLYLVTSCTADFLQTK